MIKIYTSDDSFIDFFLERYKCLYFTYKPQTNIKSVFIDGLNTNKACGHESKNPIVIVDLDFKITDEIKQIIEMYLCTSNSILIQKVKI